MLRWCIDKIVHGQVKIIPEMFECPSCSFIGKPHIYELANLLRIGLRCKNAPHRLYRIPSALHCSGWLYDLLKNTKDIRACVSWGMSSQGCLGSGYFLNQFRSYFSLFEHLSLEILILVFVGYGVRTCVVFEPFLWIVRGMGHLDIFLDVLLLVIVPLPYFGLAVFELFPSPLPIMSAP